MVLIRKNSRWGVVVISLLFGRILFSQTLQFTYDGAGNRVRQVKNGTMPVPTATASISQLQAGQNSILQVNNCSGTVTWSNNRTGVSQVVSPSQSSVYYAKCNQGGCISQSNKVNINVNNASPCNQYQYVTDAINPSQNQKVIANQRVIASKSVISPTTVDFTAGRSIELKPGFEATGGNFRAFIEPCTVAPTEGMVAYYPFSNNTNDESGNANHATPNGAMLTTDRFGNQNSAYYFDGVNDFISTPVYQNSITSYTVSFWAKVVPDGNNNNRVILQARGNSAVGQRSIILYHSSGGNNWHVAMDGDVFKGVSASNLQINNEWVHVVGVWSSADYVEVAANQFKLFINGQQMPTTENNFSSGAFPPISGAIQTILGYHQVWNQYYKGSLDDVRIYNRALSNTEIANLYQAESDASTFSNRNLLIHLPFDGNELDISGNGRNAVLPASGVTLTTDRFGVANKAYAFNGTNAMYAAWNQVTLNSARTVSVWFKSNSTTNGVMISWGGYNTNLMSSFGQLILSGSTFFGHYGFANDVSINTNPYFNNQWHQMIFTHDGSIGKLFIDGNLIKTENRNFNTSTSILKIGSNIGDFNYFNGSLDDVRIYGRALSEQEVENLYQIESNDNPLIAHYPMDGDGNDISGNNYHAINNGATPTTDRLGRANKALQFNGTSSFLEAQPLQERSISFWIQPSIQEQMQIFSGGATGNGVTYQIGIYKPNGINVLVPTTYGLLLNFWGNDIIIPYDNIKSGWHHVCVSWNGQTTVKIAIDGQFLNGHIWNGSSFTALTTQPFTLPLKPKPTVTENTLIGKGKTGPWNLYNAFWNGKLDDFRIFNRALTDSEMTSLFSGAF